MRLEEAMEKKEVETWDELSSLVQEIAAEVVGYDRPKQPKKEKDIELEEMSTKQRMLHLKMIKETDAGRIRELRCERKKNGKEIQKKLKQVRERVIGKIVEEVEQLKDDAKMFRAVRNMKNKKFENPAIMTNMAKM